MLLPKLEAELDKAISLFILRFQSPAAGRFVIDSARKSVFVYVYVLHARKNTNGELAGWFLSPILSDG